MLSVREVAARLGVCTSTVYKLRNEEKLAHVRASSAIRVKPGALEALGRRPGPRQDGEPFLTCPDRMLPWPEFPTG